jgi:prepilin-type processing-associated H-X9-DG protein
MHVSMLPFIEQSDLYDRIQERKLSNWNAAVPIDIVLPILLCPTDSAPVLVGTSKKAGTNYAGNCGVWLIPNGFDGLFVYLPPPPGPYRGAPVRLADVTDGLSNTAALSEILRASESKGRLRVNWNTPKLYMLSTELDAFASYCRSLPDNPFEFGWVGDPWARGLPWTEGAVGFTLYNHGIEPNNPSCYNQDGVASALSAAASEHSGGVNVLLGDGRVEFIGEAVDRVVWRDIGSRASIAP